MGWERSKSGTSSQTQTLPGVLSQHVDQLQADRIAERLGDRRHPLCLLSLNVGVDDRLTARLAGGTLGLRVLAPNRQRIYLHISIEITFVNA